MRQKAISKSTEGAVNIDKTRYILLASVISIAGNGILSGIKLLAGALIKSNALIGDGIDSSTDILIGIITLIVVIILSKPADAEHPWGHRRAETIATALLAFVILFAGAQLIITSVPHFMSSSGGGVPPVSAIIVTVISIAGKIALAFSQHLLGKKADSAMIRANAKNMAGDVVISAGVLIGFVINMATGVHLVDSIAAILIGIWIIRTAVSIFLDANTELMDGNTDVKSYQVIFDAVKAVDGASNPHRARMRKVAGFWDIDFDIDVDPQCTVNEAHKIASQVEDEIKRRLENVFDIMIHIEPKGDDSDEVYGLSESNMAK